VISVAARLPQSMQHQKLLRNEWSMPLWENFGVEDSSWRRMR
jgi:hypothetical protein